jgi:hypothetical protein
MSEESFYLAMLIGPALAIVFTRKVRVAWYRRGTLILAGTCIAAILVFWNLDARCSGSLIYGYRNCRWFEDEFVQIVSLNAVVLAPLVAIIWVVLTFVFLVQCVQSHRRRPK